MEKSTVASAAAETAAASPPASTSTPTSTSSSFPGSSKEDCERYVDAAVQRDPTVKFMMEKLDEAGCSVSRSFVRVEHCSEAVGGGFRPPDGVILCHNHLPRAKDAKAALIHELVHAYDHCRAGGNSGEGGNGGENGAKGKGSLDWSDCDHHACSEVRAAALSGDCSFGAEISRGNWALRAQAQACARRRAALSVAMNPACKGSGAFGSSSDKKAREAVDRVFAACFADTAPFDRMP